MSVGRLEAEPEEKEALLHVHIPDRTRLGRGLGGRALAHFVGWLGSHGWKWFEGM